MNPRIGVAVWLAASSIAACAADDTTFDDGPVLGQRLLHDVVRIESRDFPEHGFGLVVGVDSRYAYIATARHVVAKRPPAGLEGPEQVSAQIAVGFCALPGAAASQGAEMIGAFQGADDDLALLRTALPAGYAPLPRALALPPRTALGDAAWQLGREQDCTLVPTPGRIAELPDARHNLRIDLHGVLGGASGGPVISGYGIVGLVKTSSNETIRAHAIDDVQARVLALPGTPFLLVSARNIPPGDPQAAVIDLTETLNAYLFGVRDLQALLQQDVVPRSTFASLAERYNRGVERFRAARDKYDGTLAHDWSEDVLPEWVELRDQLWKIHMVVFALNGNSAKAITYTERSPPAVQSQMAALEPALVRLQGDIARFTADLGKKGIDHAKPLQ